MNSIARVAALSLALSLGACASLAPPLPEPEAELPAAWPLPATTLEARAVAPSADGAAQGAAADIGWRDFFVDPELQLLIARALEANHDLRIAALNVERARALYRVQRADRLPTLGVSGVAVRGGGPGNTMPDAYTVSLGISDFELDFFGRVRDLSRSALQQYLAQAETRQTVQLILIAEVANAYLQLAGDRTLLNVAQATLVNQEAEFALTDRKHALGAVSGLDLEQARTTVESARADAARFAGQVAQDVHALNLLTATPGGVPLASENVDTGENFDVGENFDISAIFGIPALPAGLPSEVLLRRPDMIAAEHRLRAANANIGAARAAFFPSIRLTVSAGTASDALTRLGRSGTGFWALQPSINLPIFDNGRLQSNLEVARADQEIALAQYEQAIQSGFREVADALSLSRTLAQQRAAQQALVEAATRANALSLARYKAGRDNYQVQLITQRTLFVARQALVSTQLAEQINRVTLYKVLGGGWLENGR